MFKGPLTEEHKHKISLAKIGSKLSEETKRKVAQAQIGKFGPYAKAWIGDEVGKCQLHIWVRTHKPKPESGLCQRCNIKPFYDLANIEPRYNPKTYTRDFKNWWFLCRKCHQITDGRAVRRDEKGRFTKNS